jgi:glucokinase
VEAAVVAAIGSVAPGRGLPVGVATAGVVDPRTGRVTGVNVAWADHPLRERLSLLLSGPVAVENDANAAAWAEYRFGAGRGSTSLVMITVGTGLGAGLVLGGRLAAGARGLAAEVGHVPLVPDGRPCPCGLRGCWERYVSGTALTAEATRLGPAWLPADPSAVGRAVLAAARAGDADGLALIAEQGCRLGEGLATLTALLDPDVVIVGGGLAAAGELLLGPARARLAEALSPVLRRSLPRVVAAELGAEAGVVGAADVARTAVRRADPPGR